MSEIKKEPLLFLSHANANYLDRKYGNHGLTVPKPHLLDQNKKKYEWSKQHTVWMIFGECDVPSLEKICNEIDKSSRVVFIDSVDPASYAITEENYRRLHNLILERKLQIIACGSVEDRAEKFSEMLDIKLMDSWQPVIPECMLDSQPEDVSRLIKTLGSKINFKILHKNTIQVTSSKFLRNALINAPLANKPLPMQPFKNSCNQRPVLIVAAGPSLNKQLNLLRDNQDLFTILAVDTVWSILNKNGIIPDYLLAVDSRSKPSWPINGLNPSTKLVVEMGCAPGLVWSHNSNHVFTYTNALMQDCINQLGGHADSLRTGGSVATSAFDLACQLGGNPIVFIGQDLALTGGKDHAEGYPHAYTENKLEAKKKAGFDVEGYYPGVVRTERQLMMYKTWFEERISELPEIMVINATEGGAKIKGTYQLPFEQVCNEIKSTSLRKTKTPFPIIKNGIDLIHLGNLIKSTNELLTQVHGLQNIASEGISYCKKKKYSNTKRILNLEKINKKIKEYNRNAKFVIEVFGQRELEEVTRKAHRAIDEANLQLEISMYEDIYNQILEKSESTIKMLNSILEFYRKIQASPNIDPTLLNEITSDH